MRALLYGLIGMLIYSMPALSLERFKIEVPSTFSLERLLVSSAKERGMFEKAGIEVLLVPGGNMSHATQRLHSGAPDAIDAHFYVAPAWKANERKGLCTTMVMPLVERYYFSIVSTTEKWTDVKRVVFSGYNNFTSLVLIEKFSKHLKFGMDYEPEVINGFTLPRLSLMFKSKEHAATAAADPFLEYVLRVPGVKELSPMGGDPMVISGLMVRCDDLRSPERRDLIKRVTYVLWNEIKRILDPASDKTLLPRIRSILEEEKYEERMRELYQGPLAQVSSDDAARHILKRARLVLSKQVPTRKEMEHTVLIISKSVPKHFSSEYYHFEFISGR
jgi:hypothetical protein